MTPTPGQQRRYFCRGLGVHILLRGILIAAGTVGVCMLALPNGETVAQTASFFTLASSQLIFVFICRSERRGMFSRHIFANRWLVGVVFISGVLMTAAIYIPALQTAFGFEALSKELFGISLGAAFGGAVLSSVINLILKALRKKDA